MVAPFKPRCGAYCMSAFDFMVDHMWKYDKVFCYPPIGMRIDRALRWEEFQSMLPGAFPRVGVGCRSELIFALTTVAAMKEDGRAVVLLPEGALFNQMSGAVAAREYLLNSGYLDCVISLPERMLERTQIGVSLLVLSRQESRLKQSDYEKIFDSPFHICPGGRFLRGDTRERVQLLGASLL